jgi:hypothetical protein
MVLLLGGGKDINTGCIGIDGKGKPIPAIDYEPERTKTQHTRYD